MVVESWNDIEALLREAIDGLITCPDCGSDLEPDAEKCPCGWRNPLKTLGIV